MKQIVFAFMVTIVFAASGMYVQAPPPMRGSSCEKAVEQFVCSAPIVLPVAEDKRALNRVDYQLSDVLHGVRFDMNGDGIQEQTAWAAQSSHLAFLALDRNGNEQIDNGTELFSNYTFPGVGNGFAALNRESNRAGLIREGHPLYEKLLLWEDENHDGLSQPEEIHKFSDHYIGVDERDRKQ